MERVGFADRIRSGSSIAVTCGSRGVANIAVIIRAIVEYVKEAGGIPFVFPAMGSHGGATAEGQKAILEGYGVTEEFIGAPIKSSMETVQIGKTEDGQPVFIDKYASMADGIILCGRVKAHTGFRGPYESGLMKMAVIGMGKQHGAETVHASGFAALGGLLPEVGKVILDKAPVLGGIAIIENSFDETNRIEAVRKEDVLLREPELLKEAKSKMGRLYLHRADVLVVGRVGKDISGDGMDPNVTGTYADPAIMNMGEEEFRAKRIAILDLTEGTHGNFTGIGTADVITKRLTSRMRPEQTYPNAITSTVLLEVKVPLTVEYDRLAVQVCLKTCNNIDATSPRIVYIEDTAHLEDIYVSENYMEECKADGNMNIVEGPLCWEFDEAGNLLGFQGKQPL